MRTLTPLTLAFSALALAGCGSAAVGGKSTPSGEPGSIAHPIGPTDVVLQVGEGGGFVAPQFAVRQIPSFTLLGDGTVLTPGAVPEIFPGPAVAPIFKAKLNEEEVQALLRRATDAGLMDTTAPDYGDMGSVGIADAGTTTVTIHAGGADHSVAAYALSTDGGSGLSAAQVAARKALSAFVAELPSPSGATAYAPSSYTAYIGKPTSTPQAGASPVVWPGAGDLATIGSSSPTDMRCVEVTGVDATALGEALAKANDQTQWVASSSTNATFSLTVRPGIPGDVGCAPAA